MICRSRRLFKWRRSPGPKFAEEKSILDEMPSGEEKKQEAMVAEEM